MSLNELFNMAGAKPKVITPYTSSTGTHVPTVNMARCLVRLQAGGSGGHSTNYGGGAGAMTEWWVRIPIAGWVYVVGAGGAVSVNGSPTTLGALFAMPGSYGNGNGPGVGGAISMLKGWVDTDGAAMLNGGCAGVSGGHGGYGSASGGPVGHPISDAGFSGAGVASTTNIYMPGNGQGNGSGGDSFYGKGGTTGNAPAATAYGAGGGINAAGRGGYIEIWDFGA